MAACEAKYTLVRLTRAFRGEMTVKETTDGPKYSAHRLAKQERPDTLRVLQGWPEPPSITSTFHGLPLSMLKDEPGDVNDSKRFYALGFRS